MCEASVPASPPQRENDFNTYYYVVANYYTQRNWLRRHLTFLSLHRLHFYFCLNRKFIGTIDTGTKYILREVSMPACPRQRKMKATTITKILSLPYR